MAEAETRAPVTTWVVAVRYETPPVAGLAPQTWSSIETSADERRARDGARLIAGFVESGGGAVAVIGEREGAPPRLVETYGRPALGEGIASVARTPASVRTDFATAMSAYWTSVLASRPEERASAPKAHVARRAPSRAVLVGGLATLGFLAGVLLALRLLGPVDPAVTASVPDAAELEFQRAGGFVMMRPSPGEVRTWEGETLYRAYRVHPDGRREFVGLRLADGSEPAPPPAPDDSGGIFGDRPSSGTMDHLRAISESFR